MVGEWVTQISSCEEVSSVAWAKFCNNTTELNDRTNLQLALSHKSSKKYFLEKLIRDVNKPFLWHKFDVEHEKVNIHRN